MMNALSILLAVNSVSALRGGSSGRNRKMQQEEVARPVSRNLSSGLECTVDDFADSVGTKGDLASLIGLANDADDATIQAELDSRCETARAPTV